MDQLERLYSRLSRHLDCIPNLEGNLFLLQDWRDSHLAYLQHKTALNRPCRPSSAGAKEKHAFFIYQFYAIYVSDLASYFVQLWPGLQERNMLP